MPRDLGQSNENRQTNDWERIESESGYRAQLQKKWDAEHDVGPEFERAARPLGPDYGADRPRHREISPEVAAEFGRTPEELQQLRERDPRGAGRHARLSDELPTDNRAGNVEQPDRGSVDGRTDDGQDQLRLGERSGPSEIGPGGRHDGERTRFDQQGGLGDRLGLGERPGLRESPRHLRDVPIDENPWNGPERSVEDAVRSPVDRQLDLRSPGVTEERLDGPAEPSRTERVYPPSWLTSADRPPPIEQTRTYSEVGYLDEPLPSEQRSLEEVMPRDEQGNVERFADPRQDWTVEVNGVGPILEPGRGSNCMDCTLSAISTWHGEPRVSAPRHAEYDRDGEPVRTGERDGPKRAENWLGHSFESVGAEADTAFGEIERRLADAGHGASAAIVNGWAPGGAHAWNAFNYQGKVYWVDTQFGDVSEQPLYSQAINVRAIMMDSEGNKA